VRTRTDRDVPIRWPSGCVTLVAHVQQPPPDLTPSIAAGAMRAAAAAWSRPQLSCTGFELRIEERESPPAAAANDGTNQIFFRPLVWAYEPSAVAITTVFARQDTGLILDADIEVNATRFRWGDLVAGAAAPDVDLQNTLTHEFGHLLGLDHNCLLAGSFGRPRVDDKGAPVPECQNAPPAVREATLFPAIVPDDVARRTLSDDDIAAVCSIYPALGAPSCEGADGGADANGTASLDAGADASGTLGPDGPGAGDEVGRDLGGGDLGAADRAAPDAAAVNAISEARGCDCNAGGRAGSGGWLPGLLLLLVSSIGRARRA